MESGGQGGRATESEVHQWAQKGAAGQHKDLEIEAGDQEVWIILLDHAPCSPSDRGANGEEMATVELSTWRYKRVTLRNSHLFQKHSNNIYYSTYYIHSSCFGTCKDAKNMVPVLKYPKVEQT